MNSTYQERPRKGGGTECLLPGDGNLRALIEWRRLLPVSFTAENAQKVHDGSKTQTRRLLNPQPPEEFNRATFMPVSGETCFSNAAGKNWPVNRTDEFKWLLPRYRVGDVLWVQEPWRVAAGFDKYKPTLLADFIHVLYEGAQNLPEYRLHFGKLRPARFMPLRFTRPARYEVTAVRLERVNKISEVDAVAEGCDAQGRHKNPWYEFADLWNSIHTKLGTRFEDAPWVFAYTLRRVA